MYIRVLFCPYSPLRSSIITNLASRLLAICYYNNHRQSFALVGKVTNKIHLAIYQNYEHNGRRIRATSCWPTFIHLINRPIRMSKKRMIEKMTKCRLKLICRQIIWNFVTIIITKVGAYYKEFVVILVKITISSILRLHALSTQHALNFHLNLYKLTASPSLHSNCIGCLQLQCSSISNMSFVLYFKGKQ